MSILFIKSKKIFNKYLQIFQNDFNDYTDNTKRLIKNIIYDKSSFRFNSNKRSCHLKVQ
jgi:hypothetical protein